MLVLCSVAALIVTPPYEAPDEPAHLDYVDHLLTHSSLPTVPEPGEYDILNYEAHQPPLAYAAAAALLRMSGGRNLPARATPDTARFSFSEPGSRMFLPLEDGRIVRSVRVARAAGIIWLGLTLVAMLLALQMYADGVIARAAALACVGGCPQFIWLSGVMNNDAALVATSSWTTLCLVVLLRGGDRRWLIGALVSASLAVLAKGSALFLAGGFVIAGAVLIGRRGGRSNARAVFVLVASAAPVVVLGVLNQLRTGSPFPPLPATAGGGWMALVQDSAWPARLAYSFWAKFGWMNTPMHPLWYLWFGVVTLAAFAGLILIYRTRRADALLLVTLLLGNFAIVVGYLVSIDFQTQGRYLHPVLIVLAISAGAAFDRVGRGAVLYMTWLVGLSAPVAAVLTVWRAFQ